MNPCHCGHDAAVHEHYRASTDCSLCACRRFERTRAAGGLIESLRMVLAALRPKPGRHRHAP